MYYHITQTKRIELSLLLRLGHSLRHIALVLGVSPSTVTREIKRNSYPSGKYHAAHARVLSYQRRSLVNGTRNKLLAHPKLARLVELKLTEDLSPEQISGWLKDRKRKLRVSTQTIYDWIDLHARHLLVHLHCRKGKYRRK